MTAIRPRFGHSTRLLAFVAGACLPADTRPPPATIALVVSSNDASQQGVTTDDGWTITIDRFFVGIGDAGASDACINYSDAHYGRLLDATRPEDQKLAILFALGQCDLGFRISGPDVDMILGTGVTEDVALGLAVKDTDPYVTQATSASIAIAATATRGSTVERLNWSFRQGIGYRKCQTPVDGKPATPLDFPSDGNFTFHIVLHPEVLLRDNADGATASLRFDPIAAADAAFGNADGEVTLSELGGVSLDEVRKTGPYGIGDADASKINTLEDYVYLVLRPAIPQFREAILCTPMTRPRHD